MSTTYLWPDGGRLEVDHVTASLLKADAVVLRVWPRRGVVCPAATGIQTRKQRIGVKLREWEVEGEVADVGIVLDWCFMNNISVIVDNSQPCRLVERHKMRS